MNSFKSSNRRPLWLQQYTLVGSCSRTSSIHSERDELKGEYVLNVFICRIARKLPLVCTLQRSLLFLLLLLSVCWACCCCLRCCELDKFSSHLTNLPRLTRCLYYITQFTLRYICTEAIKHTLPVQCVHVHVYINVVYITQLYSFSHLT